MIKHPGFLKTYEETEAWIDDYVYNPYGSPDNIQIDPNTLEVDIADGNCEFSSPTLEYILVKFRNVNGSFRLNWADRLKSLIGSPDSCDKYIIDQFSSICDLEGICKSAKVISISNIRTLVTFYGMEGVKVNHINIRNSSNSLVSYAHEGNTNGYTYGNLPIVIDDTKINSYINYLSQLSPDKQTAAIEWLKKVDIGTFNQIAHSPYLIEHALRHNDIDIEISDTVRKIADVDLKANHRM